MMGSGCHSSQPIDGGLAHGCPSISAPLANGSHYESAQATNLVIKGVGPSDAGAYQVVVSNSFGMVTSQVASVLVHCVDSAGLAASPPYTNWTQAATNIQAAVDVAATGSIVLVTNGTYARGGGFGWQSSPSPLTNRVVVMKPLVVMSVNGPEATTIQGAWQLASTNGPSAVRCVHLYSGAGLNGFTVQGGATLSSGYDPTVVSGGGVWCYSTNEVIANCRIIGNSAMNDGGGVYQGALQNCVVVGNTAGSRGGGTYSAILKNCSVADNSATSGGGAHSGTLNNCTLTGNSAATNGGGAYSASLNNCTLEGNSAANFGGGAYTAGLVNCTLMGNSATNAGGGAFVGTLNNCTLTGNSASQGGGVAGGWLTNCIVYYNAAMSGSNYSGGTLNYCCTTPLPTNGLGNITNAPLFVDLAGNNLRLQTNSPCINAGNNAYAPKLTDLDGNQRIAGFRVDIGAYEFQGAGLSDFAGWLWQYGLPTDGSADYLDTDHDGLNNWQEWRSGTVPTNALSVLRMVGARPAGANVTVTWQSVAGVSYFLERGTALAGQPVFSLLATNLLGQAGTTSYTDTNAAGGVQSFYRVGVVSYVAPTNPPRPVITWQSNPGAGTVTLSWSGAGYRLQAQTNGLSSGPTNWFDYPGGTSSPVTVPVDSKNRSVFYRLVWP